jgi:hypothetical protein
MAIVCIAASTLVCLVLIGVPAAQLGLLLALVKAVVEAYRLLALKMALTVDLNVVQVAFGSSVVRGAKLDR